MKRKNKQEKIFTSAFIRGITRTLPLTIGAMYTALAPNVHAANDVQVENVPSAEEIVRQCDAKPPGNDQTSRLTIRITDRSGNERTTVYARLWKDTKGKDNVVDKMVLYTVYPPDAKDTAFMRWSYTPESGKNAEQWIYLPELKKIRRVSVRDLSDSFLGTDLTYGDITQRRVNDDEHKFLRIETTDGNQYFVIDSVPKESTSIYSHKITKYLKTDDMNNCVKTAVDYYDKNGAFLKRQQIKWQKIGDAWVWDNVFVENVQAFHTSYFEMRDVKVNSDIKESIFTERQLARGLGN